MPLARKKRREEPSPPKAPPPKRLKPNDDDDDDELSESELSDLDAEFEIDEGLTKELGDSEEDSEEEEQEQDSDTPDDDEDEEVEDSYVFEEEEEVPEDEPKLKGKAMVKETSRTPGRRKSTQKRQTLSKKSKLNPTVSVGDTITVARTRNTAQSRTAMKSGKGGPASSKSPFRPGEKSGTEKTPTIRLTLKMAKDKLREATSAWTPPPGALDSGPGTTAATPESSAAAPTPKEMISLTRAARGRKVIEESSEDDDEDEDEDEDGLNSDDVEGEEDVEDDEDDELNDEDAEGETDDEMLDSDGEEIDGGTTGTMSPFRSRTGTPDLSKLTKRQKSRLDEVYSADLLELPAGIERPGAAKAVPLTADEQALKRAEMARRRKNATDQRLEEEKMDTINKLLKRQTPKMRKGRVTGDATPAGILDADGGPVGPPPTPMMVRWVSNKDGIRVGVPSSWLVAPIGQIFHAQTETARMRSSRGRLIEVIDESGTAPMEIAA